MYKEQAEPHPLMTRLFLPKHSHFTTLIRVAYATESPPYHVQSCPVYCDAQWSIFLIHFGDKEVLCLCDRLALHSPNYRSALGVDRSFKRP